MTRSAWCSIVVMAALAVAAAGQTAGGVSGPWVMEQSGTTAGLRGIHAVNASIAWASGTGGTILRTLDGGETWQRCATPPGAEKLDFRGIWAWDAKTAIAMSSGPGDASRLYKTVDGCVSWKLLFRNPDKDGFWDGIHCSDKRDCLLLGDPVDGHYVVRWFALSGRRMSPAAIDEYELPTGSSGAFAASNTSLSIIGGQAFPLESGQAWFGTGGGWVFLLGGCQLYPALPKPHTLYDMVGPCWKPILTPLAHGNASSGVFSLAFCDPYRGIAVGGDYTKPNDSAGTAAWSADGGKTWTAAAKPPHGYRSAVAWDRDLKAWIAAGTNGSDISYDDGKTWVALDDGNWNALSLPWVVGPDGRIGKLDAQKLKK